MAMNNNKIDTKISTTMLLSRMKECSSIEGYIEENEKEFLNCSFAEYITQICREKSLIPERVIKESSIDRTYGHQIFNGTRRPSRDKVLLIALGMHLSNDETRRLLQVAGRNQLYPRIKRDAVLLFAIENKMNLDKTQELLLSLNEKELGEY